VDADQVLGVSVAEFLLLPPDATAPKKIAERQREGADHHRAAAANH
jgi:hypothetical protein